MEDFKISIYAHFYTSSHTYTQLHHKSHIMSLISLYIINCSTYALYLPFLPYTLSGDNVENGDHFMETLYGWLCCYVIIKVWQERFNYMENLMSERKSDQRSTLLAEIIVWRDGTPRWGVRRTKYPGPFMTPMFATREKAVLRLER